MLRGTTNEMLTYDLNPEESRERTDEGMELILRAWTEPEFFGWAHIKVQPGLPGPRIIAPPMMAPGFPRPMLPRTAARSTASALGSHAPVEGVSRR
jgi:hypothetical protein